MVVGVQVGRWCTRARARARKTRKCAHLATFKTTWPFGLKFLHMVGMLWGSWSEDVCTRLVWWGKLAHGVCACARVCALKTLINAQHAHLDNFKMVDRLCWNFHRCWEQGDGQWSLSEVVHTRTCACALTHLQKMLKNSHFTNFKTTGPSLRNIVILDPKQLKLYGFAAAF